MKTLILVPLVGIGLGTLLFLAVQFLRWLGYLLDTNDTAAAVFGIIIVLMLVGTARSK